MSAVWVAGRPSRPVLADLFILAHGAVVAMADVAEGLEVDTAAMARNLAAADVGSDTGASALLVQRALAAAAWRLGGGLMPFTIRDGVRLYWRQDGSAGKPALLLLNSIGTGMELWDGVVPLSCCPAFCVIRMDTRGHGASDAPEGDYTLVMLANDAAAVLDAAGVARAAVCGISLGGMVAMTLALLYAGAAFGADHRLQFGGHGPVGLGDARRRPCAPAAPPLLPIWRWDGSSRPGFQAAKPEIVETTRAGTSGAVGRGLRGLLRRHSGHAAAGRLCRRSASRQPW